MELSGAVVALVQFSVQGGGVGSCFPGKGTSPARADVDRQRASREIVNNLFMVETPVVKC